jgi:hypothetical protein
VDRSLRDFGQTSVPLIVTMNFIDIFASAVPDLAVKTQNNVFDLLGEIRKQFHV